MEQKTVVDTSLRELRRHGSDDFPIGIYRDDFSEFEHGQIAWHWHDEIQFDYIKCPLFCIIACSAPA